MAARLNMKYFTLPICCLSVSTVTLSVLTFSVVLNFTCVAATAQDLEPRSYANIPVGMNFLVSGYTFAEGGVATDPSLPLENAELKAHGAVLAYARSLDLWGNSGKFDAILPHAWLSGNADVMGEPVEREVSGLGDPRIRMSVNLYGAPALSMKEYAGYVQDTIIGASLQVLLPLGQYDENKLVNIGSNRFAFKPEIGISKNLAPFTIETAAAALFFTDNDDFFNGKKREQDPIVSFQVHLLWDFWHGFWIGVDGTYYTGGRTTVNGIEGNDLQENTRTGLTFSIPVNRKNSIKLFASTGVSTRTGSDFDIYGAFWQHRWGVGL